MINNASPIIFLSKINRLRLLRKLFHNIFISKEVYDEVLIKDRPGTIEIEIAVKQGWIKVIKEVGAIDDVGIKGAESSVISLARQRKDKLLIDDAIATKVAKAFNIKTIRTTTIIFMAVNKAIINKKQALSLLEDLIEAGYYISPSYYVAILKELSNKPA